MSQSPKKKWIIKSKQGAIRGPFFTDEVLRQIRNGQILGGELIALFPGTEWFPISQAPEFYDQLLSVLQGLPLDLDDEIPAPSQSGSNPNTTFDNWTEASIEEKSKAEPSSSQKSRAQRVSSDGEDEPQKPKTEKSKNTRKASGSDEVIELSKRKDNVKKIKKKQSRGPLIIISAALIALLLYVILSPKNSSQQLHLLEPLKDKTALSKSDVGALLREGGTYLAQSNFKDNLTAQNKFVQAYEGDNKSAVALSLLCISYYHLWPFVAQDSQDLRTLTKVTQYVSQINPTSIEAFTCRSIDLILRGRPDEAMSNIDSVIEANSRSENPPTAFYYFKAQLLKDKKEYSSAQNYAQSAQQLWPQWMAAFYLEAEVLFLSNKMNEAASVLAKILSAKADHYQSQMLLGIIEANSFRNYDRAESFLKSGFSYADQIPKELLALGYLSYAEMSLARGDNSDALSYAKKSFQISSSLPRAKAIIIQLGGEKSLTETKRLDRQLMYEADQLVREDDCLSAQALYKSAFTANPKNAMAAMKAAECLWRLSLATESIDWLNKAIKSDYKLIDAYTLLADYYSQRYMFKEAGQVLQAAGNSDPRNYKVYRGLAQLELRRRNAKGAIAYAQKAIELYESDVQTYVILAKAHIILAEDSKALIASGKAIELDINDRSAQIAYAESLFGAQGAPTAIDYLSRLVSLYPLVSDYRFALGEAHLRNQSYSQAIVLFQQVRRMESKPKQALMALGEVYQKQRLFEKALDTYLEAAALDPSDVEPVFKSGLVYMDINKALDAKGQFARVLRVNKDYPLANYYLGKASMLMNSPAEALKQAKIEAQKNPNLADPYILAAEAYDALEQYNLCASEYQQAAKLRPASSDIYVKMARCYRLAGGVDSALSMLRIAKKLESGNAAVYRELGLVFQTQGANIEAIESYNQYLILAPNASDAGQVRMQIDRLSQ